MQRILSLEQTPGLSVPLRFFLGAPVFALAAAMLLLWYGPQAMTSRWSPLTLAATHLLTLGFLSMTMIGALLQILPVVSGIDIPGGRRGAGAIHLLLIGGTLALAAGFLSGAPLPFRAALVLLPLGFGLLFGVALRGLWQKASGGEMLQGIRLATAALAGTVALGAAAATTFAWPLGLPLMALTDAHAAWGLGGWLLILVAGVAYQVVPMFQVTPVYPRTLTRWLAPAMFVVLPLWSLAGWPGAMPASWPADALSALGAALLALFCGYTLRLLRQRKRPNPDATTWFWRIGLASGIACSLLLWAGEHAGEARGLLLGILMIVGFGASIVSGMLYKIVPFLVWHHLQQQLAGAKAPNMRQIISDAGAMRQCRAHLAALLLLLAAAVWPQALSRPAALAFALSSALLGWNLLRAVLLYRKTLAQRPS
ncbi:hypothetical protein [Noviherbaspirillum aridicola]|uniref:Permease n=1 Tax=Noviherbaspirillum aridicola TaxID=2849687 RepID=A0ABQ4Q3S6_9BURK|nr:hypothetical protein [Noviherbaspirillum aridicola]GIZ51692.1 hypothetical protein NCCP691_17060 [Noviherbaspirillum aridicola]